MINLFQGGGIYSYGDSTTIQNFQDWIQDSFAGQPGDTDPYAGYHYNTLVQTVDQVNKTPGHAGQRRLLDEDVGRLRGRHVEGHSELHADCRRALRHSTHAGSGPGQQPV